MSVLRKLLLVLVAAGLLVDAYVHWHLAPTFDGISGTGSPRITEGMLFRVEAASAVVALVVAVIARRRWAVALAFLVAIGGLAAVVLYRYVDVGAFGPVPDMYEPFWYAEKNYSAIGELVAALSALAYVLLPSTRAGRSTR